MFVHLAAKRGQLDENLANKGHRIATEIVNEVIPAVGDTQSLACNKKPMKRENSLTKMINAVKSISSSRPKSKSKMEMEVGK